MKRLLMTAAFLAFGTSAAAQQLVVQAPRDVAGWQATTWGMTPAQVAATISRQLTKQVPCAPWPSPDEVCYMIEKFTVGAWVVDLRLDFTRAKAGPDTDARREPAFGLERVTLSKMTGVVFPAVLQELKSKYGTPIEEHHDYDSPTFGKSDDATWLFPSTEVYVIWAHGSGASSYGTTEVRYRLHRPNPF